MIEVRAGVAESMHAPCIVGVGWYEVRRCWVEEVDVCRVGLLMMPRYHAYIYEVYSSEHWSRLIRQPWAKHIRLLLLLFGKIIYCTRYFAGLVCWFSSYWRKPLLLLMLM